uniref:hypothetical protein n=1 Tax=Nocardia suismassiliense TaxID=2077092 RepID=UPI003F4998E5
MKSLSTAVVSVGVIAALIATPTAAGVASAQPDQEPASIDVAPSALHYEAEIVDRSVVLRIDSGSLIVAGGNLQVLAPSGQRVAAFPVSYQRDGRTYSVATQTAGTTAILTPSTDTAASKPAEHNPIPLRDIAIDPQSAEFNRAVANFQLQSGLGISLGALVGTIIGATIGCIAGGAAVGAAVGVPTIGTLAIPGFLGGCLVTGAALGAIGAVAGTVLIGGPVALAAALLFVGALGQQALG